jgi:1-acyl-sn-glycerol-3-phosphate acyltransferase
MLCWAICSVVAAVIGFPAFYLTGRIDRLWKLSLWASRTGYRFAGIRVRTVGREKLEDGRAYIFMSNHASNLDPPVITDQLGRRIFIIAKQELFQIPLFGRAMREAGFVAVNRADRRSAARSMREVVRMLQSGLGMLVFPEGTRSRDGKMLPFQKGPFHLALDAGVPIVPITITGSHEAWPKGVFAMVPGEIVVHFHAPIDPHAFTRKEDLLAVVRTAIESALPEAYRNSPTAEPAAD